MRKKRKVSRKISDLLEEGHPETVENLRRFQDILTRLSYEGKAHWGRNLKEAGQLLRYFRQEVGDHIAQEEKVTFPFLEAHLPKVGPFLSLLRSEHQDFKKNLHGAGFLLDQLRKRKHSPNQGEWIKKLKEKGMYMTYLLLGHLQEESHILYRAADHELHPDEKKDLAKKIQRRNHHG